MFADGPSQYQCSLVKNDCLTLGGLVFESYDYSNTDVAKITYFSSSSLGTINNSNQHRTWLDRLEMLICNLVDMQGCVHDRGDGGTCRIKGGRRRTTMLFIIRSSVLDMMDMMKRKSWGSKNDLDAVVSRKRSAEQTIRARKRGRR